MATGFNLPGSSYAELKKIIIGYSHIKNAQPVSEIARVIGIQRTTISASNKFLVDVGVANFGNNKAPTEVGRKLGRALEHRNEEDARRLWQEAIKSNDRVASIVTALRSKGEMGEGDFAAHILYVSGQKTTGPNKVGARCLTEILCSAGLVVESDGKFKIAHTQEAVEVADVADEIQVKKDIEGSAAQVPQDQSHLPRVSFNGFSPTIAINLELQLPATENFEVYDNLFRALRKHLLLPPDDSTD